MAPSGSGSATRYRLTRYTPEDESAVLHLQRLLWAGGERGNRDYLRWKYPRNPYLDDRYVVLAWDGDQLVGMAGAFGALWEAEGGQTMMLPCLADDVIEPNHRGGALFSQMLDQLVDWLGADGVPWLLDFGDQPTAPLLLMRGWRQIGPWPLAVARRDGPLAAGHAWPLDAAPSPIRGERSGCEIRPGSSPRPQAMAVVAASLPPRAALRHVRDAEYLSWRFDNPLARHFYLTAGHDPLQGYLVAHRARSEPVDGPTPTTIIECEAASDALWMDLLECALSLLPGSELHAWARDLAPGRLAALPELGFRLESPTGRFTRDGHLPHLLVRAIGPAPATPAFTGLDSPSAWDLRAVCGRSWR